MKKFKSIYLVPIFLIFILIITIYFVYDYNNTKQKNSEKNKEEQNYTNKLSEELKQNIPDKGDMIFIELFTDENKNKDILPLMKQYKFRKSLYYVLNRQEITQNETNLKPLSLLFTKAFFQDNTKYFPKPFLPHNEDSMNIYKDLDLKNYGFNETKALQCLEEAWNNLNSEEKNKDYVLRFVIDKDVTDINFSIQEKIITQINNLFLKFLTNKDLDSNKLKIEITEKGTFDIRLSVASEIDEYNQEEYYFHFIRSIFHFKDDSKISINLSHIKQYLENKRNKGQTIENNLFGIRNVNDSNSSIHATNIEQINNLSIKYLQNENLVINSQGIFESEITDLWDTYDNNIRTLFPSLGLGPQSQQEESSEIKELKQKTFEEIFEKILCLLHEQMLNIPVCVHNIESTN
ncbi:hypothetical protein CWO85_03505 [Candidatus Phytoplasma ziziphi]|uniref:Uncharacterized protein n=1 Tax=Ziziphus jujuba witches'-broom phytoplasma TaxID=135727 RepID=A0A660HNA9_ZIZJU|nr:hypothetical protein [Candidatus Phytoplasma ziziphi]AYJ01537.1 hypothetical protein CWO85_03505 [Candidatus Phytoplasma ziziphi]